MSMRQSLRQDERFLTPLPRLGRIAAPPQHLGQHRQAVHPRVMHNIRDIGAVPLGIVERYGLHKMLVGWDKRATLAQDLGQKYMRPQLAG